MKTYNEMAKNALRRIGEHEQEVKEKRKTVTRTVTPLLSFCLVATVGFAVWLHVSPQNSQPKQTDDRLFPGTPDYIDNSEVGNKQTDTEQPDDRNLTVEINEISSSVSAAQRYFDPDLHTKKIWDTEKTAAYFGVDFTALPFSDTGWNYGGKSEFPVIETNTGEVAVDRCRFFYQRGEDKKITISASKLGCPYDYLYLLESEKKTSFKTKTGGTEILLGGTKKEDSEPYENGIENNADLYEFCFADFEIGGIYFRVEAENVTGNEFHDIVKDVILF